MLGDDFFDVPPPPPQKPSLALLAADVDALICYLEDCWQDPFGCNPNGTFRLRPKDFSPKRLDDQSTLLSRYDPAGYWHQIRLTLVDNEDMTEAWVQAALRLARAIKANIWKDLNPAQHEKVAAELSRGFPFLDGYFFQLLYKPDGRALTHWVETNRGWFSVCSWGSAGWQAQKVRPGLHVWNA